MACGGGEASENAALGAASGGGRSDTVSWALAEPPRTLDPLYAARPDELLAARQLYEPLVSDLGGPFDFPRRLPGLALSVEPSTDATVWRARLRTGVRFQDGTPFNSSVVLENVERWQAAESGRRVVGPLLADAPRPDLVRFILPAPDPDFDQLLSSPVLGIVSSTAIRAAAGGVVDPDQVAGSGTGPFEIRDGDAGGLLLARNTEWWGTEHNLGPGVDQIELRVVSDPGERLALLRDGSVQVADLTLTQLGELRSDPLLTSVERGARPLGVERSVRGIPAGDPAPPLNAVWLTGVDAG